MGVKRRRKRRQVLLDKALAKEMQTKEEWKARTQVTCVMEEVDKQEKLK